MIEFEGEHEFEELLGVVRQLPRHAPPPQVLVRMRSKIVFRRRLNRFIGIASTVVVVGAGLTVYSVVRKGSGEFIEQHRLLAEHTAEKAKSLNVAMQELREMEQKQPAFSPLLVNAKRRVYREQQNTMDQLTGFVRR